MNILSLFDGMSCGQIALKELGITVKNYYAAEIDKFAIEQTKHNFPNTIHLGSVTDIKAKNLDKIDLLIGGSPCQGFSFAGKQLNFNDPRSSLFFEFVRLWQEIKAINPNAKFLLENVNMKKEYLRVISEYLEVFPVRINSNLVSAQNRDRWYWTNIKTAKVGLFNELYADIPQPTDRKIFLKDILQPESQIDPKYYLTDKSTKSLLKWGERNKENGNGFKPEIKTGSCKSTALTTGSFKSSSTFIKIDKKGLIKPDQNKASCFTAGGNSGGNHSDMDILLIKEATKQGFTKIYPVQCVDLTHTTSKTRRGRKMELKSHTLTTAKTEFYKYTHDFKLRRLTPLECNRLQTIPPYYKWVVSDSQQYKMLGNGWTVEIIKHIFSFL